jgi:hypothetical protein
MSHGSGAAEAADADARPRAPTVATVAARQVNALAVAECGLVVDTVV